MCQARAINRAMAVGIVSYQLDEAHGAVSLRRYFYGATEGNFGTGSIPEVFCFLQVSHEKRTRIITAA